MAGYFWDVLQSVQLKSSVLQQDLSVFYSCFGNFIKLWTENMEMTRDNGLDKGRVLMYLTLSEGISGPYNQTLEPPVEFCKTWM